MHEKRRNRALRQFIASKENDKIKLFKKIASNKKYRSEYGLFPLEGVRLVEDAAMENAEMSFVIASEATQEKFPELLEKFDERHNKYRVKLKRAKIGLTKKSDPDVIEHFDRLCNDAAEDLRELAIILKGKANLKAE